jgi:hypothetical protein
MNCGRRDFWPATLAKHGPAEGHACLADLAQGTVCKILGQDEVKPHKVRYYLEQRDPPPKRRFPSNGRSSRQCSPLRWTTLAIGSNEPGSERSRAFRPRPEACRRGLCPDRDCRSYICCLKAPNTAPWNSHRWALCASAVTSRAP